jgi:hypothetical protein
VGPRCLAHGRGVFKAWFAVGLSRHDEAVLGHATGDSDGQQVWEALCLLVALRVWKSWWQRIRVKLALRGDNVACLILASQLRGKSMGLNLIASELALDLGDASFAPDTISHTPGVANTLADVLSRTYQPGKTWELPASLRSVPETLPPQRGKQFWRTLLF